ncbi:MAG: Ribonuclease P protein component [Candidatus Gottesmanbacteria bacterium GW2011_GWB1_49_7]|uniref:Ribonuclease P protein component n=1 Tax=Candidatus Gottesmanbacteria bacterium GW2011_GWB1_49_7 TaxID=1618448 RepID=A0A0G1VWP8_9BACT|nr:MAG: Ribonuclease P protein component [Candidatus Gottesmanbacteria bacterium GW2011_GWB1_49_7]
MLPSIHRLPKQEIPGVLRYGARVTDENIVLRYKKTKQTPRFAFVVSTKVDKRATARNRMRRVLSESVRLVIDGIAPCDGVFTVKKPFQESGAVALLQQARLV